MSGAGNSRFTFDPAEEVVGVWSRDGNMLAYRIAACCGRRRVLEATTGLEREKMLFSSPSRLMDVFLANS